MVLVMLLFAAHNKKVAKKEAELEPGDALDEQIDYRYVF